MLVLEEPFEEDDGALGVEELPEPLVEVDVLVESDEVVEPELSPVELDPFVSEDEAELEADAVDLERLSVL